MDLKPVSTGSTLFLWSSYFKYKETKMTNETQSSPALITLVGLSSQSCTRVVSDLEIHFTFIKEIKASLRGVLTSLRGVLTTLRGVLTSLSEVLTSLRRFLTSLRGVVMYAAT